MFRYLLIEKKEYENLKKENLELKNQLNIEKEDHERTKQAVEELSEEISGKTSGCNVGPWCRDCQHKRIAPIGKQKKITIGDTWYEISKNGINYCGKHTHDLCPEWELRTNFFK